MKKIKYFYRDIRRKVHDIIYYIKCFFWCKYHVIKCKALPPTWSDRDHLLLHACFQLLEDFIEQEEPWGFKHTYFDKEYVDGDKHFKAWCEENEDEWDELRELYYWWKKRKRYYDDDNYEEDNEMLHKLIDLRSHLWT